VFVFYKAMFFLLKHEILFQYRNGKRSKGYGEEEIGWGGEGGVSLKNSSLFNKYLIYI
jgi:hypothetical protein